MAAKPSKRKDESESAINDVGLTYSSNPKTHFFYEYGEECAVDPLRLTEDGIFLWHEQMLNISERDISHLWRFASELLGNRHDASVYSHVEWLRYEITLGVIVPENWDRRRPYPYKWMLVSAIYFQEARRLCEEGSVDRAWHITAMAYYHLGMNTNPSLTQSASRAATSRHAKANMKLRALVHGILDVVRDKGLARNIKQAKEKIIEFVRKDDVGMDILEEFNASTPKGARHNKDNSNIDRLENLLD
ncbi:hypothetical protein, partial [Oleiagrimonas sp. MCCC 1A03011]|uniref:hypothetical protein n=1 Tax=Oleiagrimonas sp. MCCC 1A03011 TaxID=1926883 RepID=UPI0011BF779C